MSGRRSRNKALAPSAASSTRCRQTALRRYEFPFPVQSARFAGNIVLPLIGLDLCVEVKARANGFRELYSWLNQRDVLIVKADRQEPLVILRLSLAAEIAKLTV